MHSSSSSKLKLSFDTVFYYVTDMEASIARFDLDGVLIELVPLPPGTVVPGSGNARLCFSVANLQETLAQMHARGLATGKIREKRDGKLAFFHDPDGNELCLWEEARAENPLGMEAALLHS